jgi:tRNA threonylcarbamoyladenosine biosynthesis protein TsaE
MTRVTVELPAPGETRVHTSRGVRATRALAAALGRIAPGGTVLALTGELGAGKTSFVQGLAHGLEVPDLTQVLSPTYTLVNEYPGGRLTLVHVDCYRLASSAAAVALGLDEQLGRAEAITAVEWADLLPDLMPPTAVWVRLERGDGSHRVITLSRRSV